MKYDVVPLVCGYRGMGRSLSPVDFRSPVAKENFDILIEEYFKYISITTEAESKEMFDRLVIYYKSLLQFEVPCELIVFDSRPLQTAYGHALDFLGIDISNDLTESLLEVDWRKLPPEILNDNMLLVSEADVFKAIQLCHHGGYDWLPCWVYRVIC